MRFKGIVIFLFLVSVIFVRSIPAEEIEFNIGYIKWAMCDDLNISRWQCDEWWESDSNPYYISPNQDMNITEIMKEVNKTLSKSYYNKTQIQLIINNTLAENSFNKSAYYTSEEIDDNLKDVIKQSILNNSDKYADKDDFDELESYVMGGDTNSGLSDSTVIIIMVGLIVGVGGFFIYTTRKPKTPDYQGSVGQGRIHRPQIESNSNMELRAEIEKLKQEKEQPSKVQQDEIDIEKLKEQIARAEKELKK